MKRDDIVSQAILYLETDAIVVFALAYLYVGIACKRTVAEDECEKWVKTGKFSRMVEDFCIDLLAKRVEIDWDPSHYDVLRGKNERQGVERKAKGGGTKPT